MKRQLSIRTALECEKTILEALQLRASLNNPGDREALLDNPDAIELPVQQIINDLVFVAEGEDGILGFAALLPREDGGSELDGLFVEPARWRQGIGRALVEYCASHARQSGASALHVIGNPHAEMFYRSCGFELKGVAETRFGIGLRMEMALQS